MVVVLSFAVLDLGAMVYSDKVQPRTRRRLYLRRHCRDLEQYIRRRALLSGESSHSFWAYGTWKILSPTVLGC